MMMTQAGLVIALRVTPMSIQEKVDHKDENGFVFYICCSAALVTVLVMLTRA